MIKKKCIICGKPLWVKKSNIKRGWGKYCCKKCQFEGQKKGKWLNCDYCGKRIWRSPRDFRKSKNKNFFCSRSCHCSWENKNTRCGENSPNWIAGHSVYRALLKRHGKVERCAKCGIQDKRVLAVHHRDSNRKNNKVNNLEWLCRNCHCIVHLA